MAENNELVRTVDGVQVPNAGKYTIDKSHTTVGFIVRHAMVSKVRGGFTEFEGSINVAEDVTASTVEAVIEMKSIDTRDEARDGHLRSNDFFAVDEYPTMTYKSKSLARKGADWVLEGELTLRGVTKAVELDLEFNGASRDPFGNQRIGFSANGEINRDDFGVSFNAVLDTGGALVGKNVRIEIEAEAIFQG